MQFSEESRNILLTVSYDGTNFCGWQKQTKNGAETFRTVQGELEKALCTLHKHPVETNGSGRTDSGVHAARQAVNFFTDIKTIKPGNFVPALNSVLPKDSNVLDARQVSPLLHARFNALSRTYRYFIKSGSLFAHERPYCLNLKRFPDINALNAMASLLHGEMDCSVFSAAGDQSASKSRYIKKAVFFAEKDTIVFEICANAFLWKMVRSIVGSFLHFEEKGLSKEDVRHIILSRDRKNAGPTAPSHGLFLWSIEYPELLLNVRGDE